MAWKCQRCGNCCRVEGYVRLRPGEAELLAEAMELPAGEFIDKYTHLTADRQCLSLTEKQDGSCIFLLKNNTCKINDLKPAQCRNFPHRWHFSGYEELCRGLSDPGHSTGEKENSEK